MEKLLFITLFTFLTIGCTENNDEDYYHSKSLKKYRLLEIDSLAYFNSDTLFISQTGNIEVWNDYILITDLNFMKLWIFDKKLNLIKTIGGKGNGPGEYSYPPVILKDNDSFWLINAKYKKANLYDFHFNLVKEVQMEKEKVFTPYKPLSINGKYIFFYFEPAPTSLDDYYKQNNSLVVLNKNFQSETTFLPWNNIYSKSSAYAFDNAQVLLAAGPKQGFIALQAATYKIQLINKDLDVIKSFGIKPVYYKKPPDIDFKETQKTLEAAVDFSSKITKFLKIDFDSTNNNYFTNYVNLDKDFFYQKTLLLGKHYLQVYNANYDCIFDEEIPGKLAFVENGKVYILTDEKPEYIKFKVFRLVE